MYLSSTLHCSWLYQQLGILPLIWNAWRDVVSGIRLKSYSSHFYIRIYLLIVVNTTLLFLLNINRFNRTIEYTLMLYNRVCHTPSAWHVIENYGDITGNYTNTNTARDQLLDLMRVVGRQELQVVGPNCLCCLIE